MAQWLDRVKFGNGKNGSPAVSGTINTYATCTGTATQSVLTTALSASDGDVILIHQSQGTGAGQWEINLVSSDAGATLNLYYPLAYSYVSGAQAILVPQYTGGTLSGAVTCTAWAGSSGGIIAFMSNGDLTISGSLTASNSGHIGSTNVGQNTNTFAYRGGGINEANNTTQAQTANGNAGGGGENEFNSDARIGGGGGGGNGAAGTAGGFYSGGTSGAAGAASGVAGLTTMTFGGGGGGAGANWQEGLSGGLKGGNGGGLIIVMAKTLTVSGSLISAGQNGNAKPSANSGGYGGGAGGSILIKSQVATLGTTKVTAPAGSGGSGIASSSGGAGGTGRIHLDYLASYTGTTTPTLDITNDTTLTSQVFTGMI